MTETIKTMMDLSINRTHRKIITLASLGGALEFFDFTIYALFTIDHF